MTSLLAEAYQRRLVAFDEFYNKNHSKADGKFVSGPSGSSKGKIWSGISAHPDHRKVPVSKIKFPLRDDEYQTAEQQALGLAQRMFSGNIGGGYRSHVMATDPLYGDHGHIIGFSATMRIVDKDGKKVGESSRMVEHDDRGRLVVDHSTLYINPEYHGKGIADRYNAHAIAEYQKLGVDRITLTAGDTVGGFAWARQGFRLIEEGSVGSYGKTFLLKQLDRTKTTFNIPHLREHKVKLDRDVAALRKAIEAGEDVQPIHIASLGERYAKYKTRTIEGKIREYTTWPGKNLLLRTNWHGVYYFDASQAITAAASSLEHARLRPAFHDDVNIEVDPFFNQNHSKIDGKFTTRKSGFGGPSADPATRSKPNHVQFKRNNLTKVVFVSRIKMSEALVRLNTIERCRETILHEIAHALAGHTAGHGPVWVATARRIGLINPTRCCGEDVVRTPPAFEGFCEHCGEEPISFRHKTPPSNRICSKHRTPIMWRRRGSKKILLTSR